MPGQGHYGPWLVWANSKAWEDVLKPKNDFYLVFLSPAVQRHQKQYFMNFSFDHAGCQSTVAKNEKNQEKIGQNLKILHTQELYTSKLSLECV